MKTIKSNTHVAVLLFLAMLLSACKGDDGTDGAIGPVGADGQDGNANVIYSDWIIPTWTASTYYGVQVQEYLITAPDISLDVINYGIVLMYWKNWNNEIFPLPSSGLGGNIIIDFTFTENSIYLYIFDEINGTLPPAIGSMNTFRYVIIPGNIPAKNHLNSKIEILTELRNAGVHIDDYFEVCDYYRMLP